MSHFSVLVTGDDVDAAMAPFHEFECMGRDDQYVRDMDVTAENLAEYRDGTVACLVDGEGHAVLKFDDRFFRDPTPEENEKLGHCPGSGCVDGMVFRSQDWGDGRRYRTKVHFTPDGWTEEDRPISNLYSFRQYLENDEWPMVSPETKLDIGDEHKYRYCRLTADGEVMQLVRRTNPNAKWDWFVPGGRFDGLLLKDGSTQASARAGDVDWETLRRTAAEEAAALYDSVRHSLEKAHGTAVTDDFCGYRPWSEFQAKVDVDDLAFTEAREQYMAQWQVQAAMSAVPEVYNLDAFLGGRDAYVRAAEDRAGVTFAILDKGEWKERGHMGWFGCATGASDRVAWDAEFRKFVETLDPDTRITIVDCHI